MKYLLIIFLSLTAYISALEYSSVHEQTYWFYDDESSTDGWHIGTVRTNLVYGDKLRFAISENNCNQIPAIYFTLTSSKISDIKKNKPDFNIKTLEGTKMTFKAHIDEFDPFMINATINIANEIDSVSSMFFIEFDDGMPRNFVSAKKNDPDEFIEVMMLEIPENDPNYKYFDISKIKFRMGGLVHVWMHAYEQCMSAKEAT